MSKYKELGSEVGEIVDSKQLAYGDAFNKSASVLEILYPDGVSPDDYANLLSVARILDKLFRIANDQDAFGEDPFSDIAGYSLLSIVNRQGRS